MARRVRPAAGAALVGAVLAVLGAGCGTVAGPPPANAMELEGGPEYPLFDHTATWTGDELLIWSGTTARDGLSRWP
ncbi:MAG: hypothetical protein GY773_23850 [Actinomycetia bacterium]|nr:hypothetical protein [Actinomycetes bacterium]MCP5035725.1 hypothetical protein [Actinomycetes bacterium]